MLHLDTIISS